MTSAKHSFIQRFKTTTNRYFYQLINAPLTMLMKSQVVPEKVIDTLAIDPTKPLFYVIKTNSISDKLAVAKACQKQGLPSPFQTVMLDEQEIPALLCLENPRPVFFGQSKKTDVHQIGNDIFRAHHENLSLDAQIIPITVAYSRAPGKAKANLQSIIAEAESPSWLRKFFMVVFSGRANLIRFSKPVSVRQMADQQVNNDFAVHKLIRLTRFHFYRQKLSATGPRLMRREQIFNSVMLQPSVIQSMTQEAARSGKELAQVKRETRKILDEIAADFRETYIHVASRFLARLWNKLYNGIKVSNIDTVRDIASQGHEIIYVPCHRSHMDYLLLSYVIHNEGLVAPHIAAGINLNFGPVGPILRRGGAFFLRRTFKGNKLYAVVFREYLSLLFRKGYAVEYFIEGGRSRTGRLLPAKTGMLSMTIQAMLQGIDRPVSFVPVYIGYEHVMEVTTYLKELKGSSKKSESVFGIIKAMKNLKDYGFGYVNFGQPISLKHFLNEQVPDWREQSQLNAQRSPQWLTPVTITLANKIMTAINCNSAISATTLCATILLAADKHIMARDELEAQIELYMQLNQMVPYTAAITLPEMTAHEMVDHLIKLRKVDVSVDVYGQMIGLNSKDSVLMTYYRNNTIHLFALPSFIASMILFHEQIQQQTVIDTVNLLLPLFKDEWFLQDIDPQTYTQNIIDALLALQLLNRDDDGQLFTTRLSPERLKLQLLATITRSTIQRYTLVLSLLKYHDRVSRDTLEQHSHTIAQRLSTMHGIKAPEFFDQKVLARLISSLTEHQYIIIDDNGDLTVTPAMDALLNSITDVMHNDILQSITQIIKKS